MANIYNIPTLYFSHKQPPCKMGWTEWLIQSQAFMSKEGPELTKRKVINMFRNNKPVIYSRSCPSLLEFPNTVLAIMHVFWGHTGGFLILVSWTSISNFISWMLRIALRPFQQSLDPVWLCWAENKMFIAWNIWKLKSFPTFRRGNNTKR